MARATGRKSLGDPMSLRFPKALRARVSRYAKARGLEEATAVRVLCAERLQDLELREELEAAERWQTDAAMKSWERLELGDVKTYPMSELHRVFDAARKSAK